MMEATIFNIQRYSLHDGGGIRTMVFFKGCPFCCPWCANPEGLDAKPQRMFREKLCIHCTERVNGSCPNTPAQCPTGALETVGKIRSMDEVFAEVRRDTVFYETTGGGVTLSGGEVLLYQEFAMELLERCKKENIRTAMETTLGCKLKDAKRLVNCTDTFLVDMKIYDAASSQQILHLDVELVKQNIRKLKKLGAKIVIRVPLIPGFTATEENIRAIAEFMNEHDLREAHLLPFHKLGESKYEAIGKEYSLYELQPLSDDAIRNLTEPFIEYGIHTIIGGE
ncbi:MAG: glycyl-radical enzyme activating protein [Erysipelotrichaceae bacterium]|nr:glycyl-radical enzyme activating protein [Erysipelotrichaceae bacterium]